MHRPARTLLVIGSLLIGCPTQPEGDGDDASGTDSSGDDSSSETGVGCIPSSLGCVCDEDQSCAPGLACIEGMCEFVDGCTPGTPGCSCIDGACVSEWLTCEAGICDYPCVPGNHGCECLPGGVCNDAQAECIDGECGERSTFRKCGWDRDAHLYRCGGSLQTPWNPIECPESVMLEVGGACDSIQGYSIYTVGCCDTNGNNWWCEAGALAFDDCQDTP